MAIAVDVAKDPKAIKSKFIGNFTKRQVICFGAAAVVGVPFYLLTRKVIGTDVAALMMVAWEKCFDKYVTREGELYLPPQRQ